MRENRPYGSEGGAAVKTVVPTRIAFLQLGSRIAIYSLDQI